MAKARRRVWIIECCPSIRSARRRKWTAVVEAGTTFTTKKAAQKWMAHYGYREEGDIYLVIHYHGSHPAEYLYRTIQYGPAHWWH